MIPPSLRIGRPSKQRKSLRSTYRYDQQSAAELAALKRTLDVADDSEAIRRAIQLALAAAGGAR